MSTEPIGYSNYSSTQSLLTGTGNSSKSASAQDANTTGGSLKSQIRSQIDAILDVIPKGDDGKLSFKEVETYLEEKEKNWDASVKADLEELGVDTSKEFPLSYDPATGLVTVAEGHPDKAIIDNYFTLHSDKVEEFEQIIQIGKLTSVSSNKLSRTEIMQSIQQTTMSAWYDDNSDPTSWFSGGGLLFGQNQATYKGLDIRV